jgi:hypothetical protein
MLSGTGNEGFDAGRKQHVDLLEAGIIDPTKVVRIGLENAMSVASVLLLAEATMTEIPEENKERMAEPEMAMSRTRSPQWPYGASRDAGFAPVSTQPRTRSDRYQRTDRLPPV